MVREMQKTPPLPYPVEETLSMGRYAAVYRCTSADGPVVLKLAHDRALETAHQDPLTRRQGLLFQTGAASPWDPDPREVLAGEAATLSEIDHPAFPPVLHQDTLQIDGRPRPYIVTRWIEGKSWRRMLQAQEKIPLHSLVELIRVLDSLKKFGMLELHGDLKPDNLLLDEQGQLRIIDPTSGMLALDPGGDPLIMLTTAGYNPWLEVSDMPALGILIMEIYTGEHPLLAARDLERPELTISPELGQRLQALAATGQGTLARLIPFLPLPTELCPEMPRRVETLALRCLGLRRRDDMLDVARPFDDLHELAGELDKFA